MWSFAELFCFVFLHLPHRKIISPLYSFMYYSSQGSSTSCWQTLVSWSIISQFLSLDFWSLGFNLRLRTLLLSHSQYPQNCPLVDLMTYRTYQPLLCLACWSSGTKRSSLVSMKTDEERRGHRAQGDPEPFAHYSFLTSMLGLIVFLWQQPSRKASCFWNQNKKCGQNSWVGREQGQLLLMWAALIASLRLSQQNSLGAIVWLYWQTMTTSCLTQLQSLLWSDIIPSLWRVLMHCYCSETFSDSVPGPYHDKYLTVLNSIYLKCDLHSRLGRTVPCL